VEKILHFCGENIVKQTAFEKSIAKNLSFEFNPQTYKVKPSDIL